MDKKKKDYLIFTLLFQILICAVGFGLLFGLKTANSELIMTYKTEFFDKVDENYRFENIGKKDGSESTKASVGVDNIKTEVYDETNKNSNHPVETEETELNAEVSAAGGADYYVSNDNDIPENVSVNGYVLNKKMVLPINGETTSEFGVRTHPISNELRFHAGIDIAADMNTPIYAAFDGVVSVAEYDEWNGNYIKITHDGGIMTVYCHCNTLKVKKGDTVKAGQVIATIGSTGSSTGPHLHFELRIDNVSYDPQIALTEAVNAV